MKLFEHLGSVGLRDGSNDVDGLMEADGFWLGLSEGLVDGISEGSLDGLKLGGAVVDGSWLLDGLKLGVRERDGSWLLDGDDEGTLLSGKNALAPFAPISSISAAFPSNV